MTSDADRLAHIRRRFAAIAPARHRLAYDGEGALIVADGAKGEKFEIARVLPVASFDERDFLAEAAETVGFLLGLVDRAARKVRALEPERPAPARHDGKNYAAEASMLCSDPAFKRFLLDRHGLASPATDDRTAVRLRFLLKITSRAELNSDPDAAARWKALRGDFEVWKRTG